MANDPSIFTQLRRGCGELQADTVEMFAARKELAQIELRLARAQLIRLAALVGVCALFVFAGLVVVIHWCAERMPALRGLSKEATLLLVAGVFIVGGALSAWWAVRRYLRTCRLFEQSQAELRADLASLQDWLERGKQGA